MVVGSLLALRILPSRLGGWAVAPAMLGLGLAVVLLVLSQRRCQGQREHLDRMAADPAGDMAGGGGLTLLTAVTSTGLGLLGLLLLVC